MGIGLSDLPLHHGALFLVLVYEQRWKILAVPVAAAHGGYGGSVSLSLGERVALVLPDEGVVREN